MFPTLEELLKMTLDVFTLTQSGVNYSQAVVWTIEKECRKDSAKAIQWMPALLVAQREAEKKGIELMPLQFANSSLHLVSGDNELRERCDRPCKMHGEACALPKVHRGSSVMPTPCVCEKCAE